MAAQDKLIPSAITLSNNLKGTKLYTQGNFRMPTKKSSKWANPFIDALSFLASIYAKELRVATGDAAWNHLLVDGEVQKDVFTIDQNMHHLTLGAIIAFSENEWDELQITISKVINIIGVQNIVLPPLYTPTELQNLFANAGMWSGGATPTLILNDANSVPIGTFSQGINYATAWNINKVPADAALGIKTSFLAPVYKLTVGGTPLYYYRYTGNRKWKSPFIGYDSF